MRHKRHNLILPPRAAIAVAVISSVFGGAAAQPAGDPLPSWNDGAAKKAIVEFVQATTTEGSPKFVPPPERIATFDQDGTLWVEHPMYTQIVYCLERVPAVVKAKPELAKVQPFKTLLSGNREAMAKLSMNDIMKILAATLTGMSVEEFRAEARKWLDARLAEAQRIGDAARPTPPGLRPGDTGAGSSQGRRRFRSPARSRERGAASR